MTLEPFRLEDGVLRILDQTLLPEHESWIEIDDPGAMADAIGRLAVRGAPAIGIAAALALALEAERLARAGAKAPALVDSLRGAGERLKAVRPTAVNLAWAVDRVIAAASRAEPGVVPARDGGTGSGAAERARREASALWAEDLAASKAMAAHGAAILTDARRVLTHCNTGGLATGGGGTALAVILELARRRPGTEVWITETRPLLQGARLTAWELRRAGITPRLVADGAAPHVIARGGIDAVLVGADRVARNGDVANKIGTYPLALAAREAGIPFIVVAPTSTFDPALEDGSSIPIEERDSSEVTSLRGVPTAAAGVEAHNPAFDVTPARLVTHHVTERGVGLPEVPVRGG
ncbi:MAG TPA: S-methyl-5-thioribose-1-phosphate isomerase [Candidatus Eisenbacteria bacterium]|nr:S-methyl-5-thioribose-1-phosphate isomerase [Candidatus Eisenbacteria bacterium]